MLINQEDSFYCQLAKSIQAWGRVEIEIYFLYADIMKGANSHLVSATFNHIESFESKIQLLNSCLKLIFSCESEQFKKGKSLLNRSKNLNAKRNKIVHEPVIFSVDKGKQSITISPSRFNSLALARGKTTYNGPAINPDYKPSLAKVMKEHEIDIYKLFSIEKEFKDFSAEVRFYREKNFKNGLPHRESTTTHSSQ